MRSLEYVECSKDLWHFLSQRVGGGVKLDVKVAKYGKFSSQSVTIFQKIRELTKKERIGELVSLAGWGSVEAEKVDVLWSYEG